MARDLNTATILATLALSLALPAQDKAAAADTLQVNHAKTLQKAVRTMAGLDSMTFRTTERQSSVMGRNIAKQTGGMMPVDVEVDVRGSWSKGVLKASVNDGDDEIIAYRGRQVARNDDVSWKLRVNRVVTGGSLPYVMDPSRLFETLSAIPEAAFKITTQTASTYKNKQVQVLGITLKGQHAQDFALAGGLPAINSETGGFMRRLGGAGGGAPEMPELTVDLAFYVEPSTGYIHKIKTRSYQEAGMGGGVQFRIQGGGGDFGADEDEEEEVAEKDKNGKRIYRRGLPIRQLGNRLTRLTFDVVLSKLGEESTMKIDSEARRILKTDK